MRQIKKIEEDDFEFVEVTSVADKYPVWLKTFRRSSPPPPPDDMYLYTLKETTKIGDAVRSWEWLPVMTPDK